MNELVSIIIPVFNVEKYLKRCLDSVLSQTYTNLEIILIDDGSTDGSSIICEEYGNNDPRIKIIHKENGGLSSARNRGIEIAKGEYLCFVDSDDCINSLYVETLLGLAINHDAEVAQCNFLCVDTESKLLPANPSRDIKVSSGKDLLHTYCCVIDDVKYTVVWNKLYKVELFENIRFPMGKQHEDEYIVHEILFNTNRLVETGEYLYYYLQRPDSIIGKGFTIKTLDILDAYKERIRFLNKHGLNEESKSTLINLLSLYKANYLKVLENMPENKMLIDRISKEYEELSGVNDLLASVILEPTKQKFDVSFFEQYFKSNWILYGAGALGQFIYEQYKEKKLKTFCFCVDNFWQKYGHLEFQVKPLDRILDTDYDYIIVGINNPSISNKVKVDLISWGVDPEKIIIKP